MHLETAAALRLKFQIVMAASKKVAESGDAEFSEDYFRFHLLWPWTKKRLLLSALAGQDLENI